MYGNRTDLTIGLCSAIEKLCHYRHYILSMSGIQVHFHVKITDFVRHLTYYKILKVILFALEK